MNPFPIIVVIGLIAKTGIIEYSHILQLARLFLNKISERILAAIRKMKAR